jgi:hypothetical protein
MSSPRWLTCLLRRLGSNSLLREPLRGQRRAAQVATGASHRTLLADRQRFRLALATADAWIDKTYADLRKPNAAKPRDAMVALTALKRLATQVRDDYGFAVGEADAVRLALPRYKAEARTQLSALQTHRGMSVHVGSLIDTLDSAVA